MPHPAGRVPGVTDPFDLRRFVTAQAPFYAQVLAELRAARKRSHWMWFIFPQLQGLGSSPMARAYAIRSLDEARAYLAHELLGPRLTECTRAVNALQGHTAAQIFAWPDELKFRSSMTLFAYAHGAPASCYRDALAKYFAGEEDPRTRAALTSA